MGGYRGEIGTKGNMKKQDIEYYSQFEYPGTCELCGGSCLVLSQKDCFPEYETDIYVQCTCGEFIHLVIPVN